MRFWAARSLFRRDTVESSGIPAGTQALAKAERGHIDGIIFFAVTDTEGFTLCVFSRVSVCVILRLCVRVCVCRRFCFASVR